MHSIVEELARRAWLYMQKPETCNAYAAIEEELNDSMMLTDFRKKER